MKVPTAVRKEAVQALFTASDVIPVSMSPSYLFFNGATPLYAPVGGVLAGPGTRILK